MAALPTLILLLAASAPTKDASACSPPAPRALDSRASFATDLVLSLARALEGTRRIDTTRDQAVSDLLQAARLVQDDFACAAQYLEPYAKSKTEALRVAAKDLAGKYRTLSRSMEGQLDWLRYLDSERETGRPPEPANAEAYLDRATKARDEASQAVALAAIQAIGTVVEVKGDSPTGRLLLTRNERKSLLALLEKSFGPAVQGGPGTDKDFATNAAAAWFKVLSSESFKARDEK